jgi:hypothetical protein
LSSTTAESKEKGVIREEDAYYAAALDPLFQRLKTPAYISVGRWSYAEGARNPLVFSAGGVGGMDEKVTAFLNDEFQSNRFSQALREFSFTKLLADTDQEVWFHFSNQNLPARGEDQVYANRKATRKQTPLIEVAALEVTPELVEQLVNVFETETKVTHYGGVPLRSKMTAISETLEAAIFSLFTKPESGIRHITFMPVMVPSARKNVVGIISINSEKHLRVSDDLEPILQPFAEGIMAPFHLREIDEQRRRFSLRSAIAAIMSRNMSHNIGSHVLWHLSQQLKSR